MHSTSQQALDSFPRSVDTGQLVDYMPYPMQKHGLRGADRHHLYRLLTRYFTEHIGSQK